jgi:hypothetical protein
MNFLGTAFAIASVKESPAALTLCVGSALYYRGKRSAEFRGAKKKGGSELSFQSRL